MYTLGIHFGHDSSAVLMKDSNVLNCIEEERLTRVKMDGSFPVKSIEKLCEINKINKNEISSIAFSGVNHHKEISTKTLLNRLGIDNKLLKLKSNFGKIFKIIGADNISNSLMHDEKIYDNLIRIKFNNIGLKPKEIVKYDHHLCHAASAFYASKFSESFIFTLDGKGDGYCGSICYGVDNRIEVLKRFDDKHSLGLLYSAVTESLGYKKNRHEGKITGLAGHGKFNKTILEINNIYNYNLNSNKKYDELYKISLNKLKKLNQKYSKEDIASGIQRFVEVKAIEMISTNIDSDSFNLCLAGGVFSNVKLNQKINELEQVNNIFVQQAMGDNGLSLGAAFLKNSSVVNKNKCNLDDVFKGPSYSNEYINNILENNSYTNLITYQKLDDNELINNIAEMISRGKIVGRFRGAMEFGPRALCNRSILIKVDDKAINDTVNKRLNRTEFMPFAPVMTNEFCNKTLQNWNEDHFASEFMTVTYNVKQEWHDKMQAVVHVDGTARPQVIYKNKNNEMHSILCRLEALTGVACCVNTSFNSHEEPIVCSPEDAINSLIKGAVDVVFLENYKVIKR